MNEFTIFIRRMLVAFLLAMVVGSLLLWVTELGDYILGWCWGVFGNMAYFLLLARRVRNLVGLSPEEGALQMKKSLAARFAMIFLILIVAVKVPSIHILSTAMGLVSLKLLIYINHMIYRGDDGSKSVRKEG